MNSKWIVALGLAVAAAGAMPATAVAQSAREAELIGFHQLCEKGDRRACVRFGIMIGESRERHAEWRRLHREWFWWER